MKIKRMYLGFARNRNGTLHWCLFDRTREEEEGRESVVIWFACFAVELLLYDQDRLCANYKKGDHNEI